MKKIVALGAIAAIAGGMMFAVPEFAPEVTLDGNATVKWGVDLDAGQHGFTNETGGDFKVKLWGEGTREFEAEDGIWAELKVTGKELKWNGKKEKDERWDGGKWELNEAKLHFNNFYVGIKSGDCQVGEYKFDAAIRSADNDNAKWLTNVGPKNFSQGVVVGYADDNLDIGVDLRSYYDEKGTNTHYTSAYAFAAEAKLKDSNEWVNGLAATAGVAYNISDNYKIKGADSTNGEMSDKYIGMDGFDFNGFSANQKEEKADPLKDKKKAVTDAEDDYKKAATVENQKKIDEAKMALKVAEDESAQKKAADAAKNAATDRAKEVKYHALGYAFNASYKFAIDDTYYVKPMAGLIGGNITGTGDNYTYSSNGNAIVAGALFGWGETKDANAGVPYLDNDDSTKKVTPGISVIAAIPLPGQTKITNGGNTTEITSHDALLALIVPSVYLGDDLVEGLKFAAYSEIGLLRGYTENSDSKIQYNYGKPNDNDAKSVRTLGLAFAAGVSYDIKATDDITVTPKAGIRYSNTAYNANNISKIAPLSNKPLFETGYGKMGLKGKKKDDGDNENYFNLKAGVDVKGFIPNTTIFAEYASANLLYDDDAYTQDIDKNKNQYKELKKHYDIKNGTFNVGCKISF
jgi:hypothetical protein